MFCKATVWRKQFNPLCTPKMIGLCEGMTLENQWGEFTGDDGKDVGVFYIRQDVFKNFIKLLTTIVTIAMKVFAVGYNLFDFPLRHCGNIFIFASCICFKTFSHISLAESWSRPSSPSPLIIIFMRCSISSTRFDQSSDVVAV